MIVSIYTNHSDNNVVDKTITQLNSVNCNLKRDTSISAPTLELVGVSFEKLKRCNYLYIPDFGRYYYVNNVTTASNYILVECSVDVLMSFKSDIRKCSGILERHESIFNAYLPDDEFFNDNRKKTVFKKFNTSLPAQSCFLITV